MSSDDDLVYDLTDIVGQSCDLCNGPAWLCVKIPTIY